MHVSLVVAIADDGAIGRNGSLPWHLPADLKFFKTNTLHKPVIMGRKTWESLGKPLKDRFNIVLSKSLPELPEGVYLSEDLGHAITAAEKEGFTEVSVIGGASLFAEAALLADQMLITRVHTKVPDADTFFPEIDMEVWKMIWEEEHAPDEKNVFAYTFQRWSRIK